MLHLDRQGGSSSEWTIVHLLGKYHTYSDAMRGVTFKDKSGKYYYVRAAYDVTQQVPGQDANYGAYGFADLLPWQGAATAVTSLGSKETIDLETKDPNGRPKVICLGNISCYNGNLLRHIFNTDASNSFWPGAPTSNSDNTYTLPGGSTDVARSDTTIAIQVPPGQIVSITYWSDYDQFYIVQDQSMTIEENVNNWKTIGYTKTDLSRDRLMKWVPVGSNSHFFSETDDFGLTISGKRRSEWTIVHFLVGNTLIKRIRGVTFKDKSGKYYYVQAAYDVTHSGSGLEINGAYGFADLLPWQGAATAVQNLGSKETIDLETKDPNGRPKAICLINYGAHGAQRNVFNTDGSNSSTIYDTRGNASMRSTLPDGSTEVIGTDTTIAIQVPPGQIVSITYWSDYDQFYIVQDQSMTIEENVNNWKTIGYTKTDLSRDRLMKWVPVGSNCKFFSETDDFGLTIQ